MKKVLIALTLAWAAPAMANVDYAAQLAQGDAILKDFTFADGEKLPSLKIHYATLGMPRRDRAGRIVNAVMVLHGTGGSGQQFLQPQFAQELYGPGQPLDIRWILAAITSSCPTASATANRRSLATD